MVKKILARLAALLILFLVLNQIYTRFVYPSDLKETDLADSLQQIKDTCSIIYLGESSNFSFSWNDRDKRRISDLVADYYPSVSMGTLNKGALHAGIYLRLLQQIPANSKAETIIVTMNLRSFGADWIHSRLESVLQRDILLLSPGPKLWNRFRMGLKAYYNPAEHKRKALLLWHLSEEPLGSDCPYPTAQAWIDAINAGHAVPHPADSAARSLATTFVRLFAFRIDTFSNPRIRDFDHIVALAQKRGWNLVFNLLSENLEKARQLTGDALPRLMLRNRDLLVKRYTRMGAAVVDNLTLVDSSCFIDKNWPTEHYTEPGRKAVARNIALALKPFYPRAFDDVKTRTSFFANFEKQVIGFATAPASTRKARSGKHSFALSPERPYTPTFYLSPEDTHITGPFTITATAYYCGKIKDKEMKMVITLENNRIHQLYRVTYPSGNQHSEWNEISNEAFLPLGLRAGDLLTAYCWYTGSDTVYVDDFRVHITPADSASFSNFAKFRSKSPN